MRCRVAVQRDRLGSASLSPDCLREERLCCRHVPLGAEVKIDRLPRPVNGADRRSGLSAVYQLREGPVAAFGPKPRDWPVRPAGNVTRWQWRIRHDATMSDELMALAMGRNESVCPQVAPSGSNEISWNRISCVSVSCARCHLSRNEGAERCKYPPLHCGPVLLPSPAEPLRRLYC